MLSWMASCCQGNPKNGPMGEVAGVTNCRPAILQRAEGARLLRGLAYLISLSSAFYKVTARAEENSVRERLRAQTQQPDRP